MSTDSKPRADAKLKTLPDERQCEIAEYAKTHTLEDTVSWLRANGIDVSIYTVSTFLAAHRVQKQLEKNELATKELLSRHAEQHPELTPEKVAELGQTFFSEMAIEQQNPRVWCLVQQTRLKKAHYELAFRKYVEQVQARKEAIQRELDAAKSKGGLSPETIEKIEHELNLF